MSANRVSEEFRLPTLKPGPVRDHCGFCARPLHVHTVAWRDMASREGRLVAANYCGSPCYALAWEDPDAVLAYLAARQAADPDETPPE